MLALMHDEKAREALEAAGYTGPRGTILFCALLAAIGGLLGSVVIAIVWNMLTPGLPEALTTYGGAAAGAAFFALVGLFKIHRGNAEARELAEDREWRREMLRQHADKPR